MRVLCGCVPSYWCDRGRRWDGHFELWGWRSSRGRGRDGREWAADGITAGRLRRRAKRKLHVQTRLALWRYQVELQDFGAGSDDDELGRGIHCSV